ncbi:hypothetical protein FGG08_000567 [Glutinoglossum americanum]|uniref:Queuine tRNA-ribosyltransferase domain-containing protein 1 n=1 Tax=Glutinoglossum americanum TaxID=1670608 RepID=A0A9P8ID04_9PEZI|nr:hypothetical protein FGG08_000567 [Glutinoglossum americanum]
MFSESALQVIEKAPRDTPPVYNLPQPSSPSSDNSPLRKFVALPNDTVLLLAPRRVPPVSCPAANTDQSISILTSVGFRKLELDDYVEATKLLMPDIVVGMADVANGKETGRKRVEKMGDRTGMWTQAMVDELSNDLEEDSDEQEVTRAPVEGQKLFHTAVFAPILPIERGSQSYYLDQLGEGMAKDISGIAIYDSSITVDLPEGLTNLPRLSLDEPPNPHAVLREISLGIDMFVIPFVSEATDAGISLDFSFPPSDISLEHSPLRPLGVDMWDTAHARDLSPLRTGCECYSCRNHHRAYIQHLLSAKEMLGWVLLQIHNLTIMDEFFSSVRTSIARGTFDADTSAFERIYEKELPEQTGQGPRVRGYQFKSEGPGEPKKNALAYKTLDDAKEKLAEGVTPSPNVEAEDLEGRGFAEKSPCRRLSELEHFSTPLHFADKYFGLNAELLPFPSGTGHMIQALKAGEIDVGIGLTEGWVAGLGKEGVDDKERYRIVGTYVETPLCWAISTGTNRNDITSVSDLRGTKIGVSRIGSGSYVMGFVLADTQSWLQPNSEPPFTPAVLGTFSKLRDAVNDGSTADFFMWEHFTSKRYYDNGSIKRVGEIYTPWSSWKIVALPHLIGDSRLEKMFESIDKGIEHFEGHREEAVEYISTRLDYSKEDATEWLGTVRFAKGVRGVDGQVVEKTIESLRKAGVVVTDVAAEAMVGIKRPSETPSLPTL